MESGGGRIGQSATLQAAERTLALWGLPSGPSLAPLGNLASDKVEGKRTGRIWLEVEWRRAFLPTRRWGRSHPSDSDPHR